MFRCVPHSLMDCVSKRARAARSKLCKCQIAFKTNIRGHVSLCFDIRSIRQDRPPCKYFQNILYSPNWFFVPFLPWNNGVLSSSVCLPFYLDTIVRAQRGNFFNVYFLLLRIAAEEGRARSAETFSIYDSLSYGLRKKKAARSAGNFSKLTSIFIGLRRNRPESVCR